MKWNDSLAYAIGLLTTDGSISKDGRHIDLTSKDIERIKNFKKALKLKNKIGTKSDSLSKDKTYYRVQFGNVKLIKYLNSIGLHNNKTKTIGELLIPDKYFFNFLRGHFDGDGTVSYYNDKRWKASFMFYIRFYSASHKHLIWIRAKTSRLINIAGSINYKGKSTYELSYAKNASKVLSTHLYPNKSIIALSRKRFKIFQALGIINNS